jgi:hypothetical protein
MISEPRKRNLTVRPGIPRITLKRLATLSLTLVLAVILERGCRRMSETTRTKSSDKENLRTEYRPGTQLDTDESHDYKSDKLEDVVDPHRVPYHKPHERVRNDLTDDLFRDEEHKNFEDAQREGKALEFFKAGMKAEAARNLHAVSGDVLSNLPPDSPEKKTVARAKKKLAKNNQKAAAKRTVAKKKAQTNASDGK